MCGFEDRAMSRTVGVARSIMFPEVLSTWDLERLLRMSTRRSFDSREEKGLAIELAIGPQSVRSVECHQATSFDHHQPITDIECRQSMGDDDDGHTTAQSADGFANHRFAVDVERRRRFVENQQLRLTDQSTGDRETLTLTTRELHSSLSDMGVETFG
jgi:hypothetical protein